MRKPVGKKLRFEILKRDEFKCRYCGRSQADGATIHVDHVIPVATGGRNDPENLVTACADCNLGKSARMIGDPAIVGVDFAKAGQIFKDAQKSLKRYQEYLKLREAWEYDLVSVVLEPMRACFSTHDVAHLGPSNTHWAFQPGFRVLPEHIPNHLKESHVPYIADIQEWVDDAEERVRTTVIGFIERMGPDGVRRSATITAVKAKSVDCPENAFAYFCGVCINHAREAMGVVR